MEFDPKLVADFTKGAENLGKTADTLDRVIHHLSQVPPSNPASNNAVSNSNFYIQAGGVMAMVLLLAAAFVLGVALDTSFSLHSDMKSMQQRQDRQDDYLQAIYQIAPNLKPKETKK
jgi:hypothetical protein